MEQGRTVVFPLYDGMTPLDFTGPHQVFSRWPGVKVVSASLGGKPVEADGLVFSGLTRLSSVVAADVLCVPGGAGCTWAVENSEFLAEIRRLAQTATYVSSVCTGSIVLAAAGLLHGRRAACHWAWREFLPLWGAVPDAGRVVQDGRFWTGGGVTAGIDFALELVGKISGARTAQLIQLGLEYAPAPPWDSGRPETAPTDIVAEYRQRIAQAMEARRSAFERSVASSSLS